MLMRGKKVVGNLWVAWSTLSKINNKATDKGAASVVADSFFTLLQGF